MARPTDYTEETAATLCGYLSAGESLRTACLREGMPDKATVFRWLAKHEEFRDQYARAKEESSDALVEEMLDISDDENMDVQRSRLMVDTRKWIASKLKPKKYGDKIHQEVTGKDGGPILASWEVLPVAGNQTSSKDT